MTPEIKNVARHELLRSAKSFQRHIVTTQWLGESLEFAVHDEAFDPQWSRPYNFCYQGTNLNPSRENTAAALLVGSLLDLFETRERRGLKKFTRWTFA